MNKIEDEKLMPPIHAIRVISCGKDWTSDTDTTLPVDKIRGFSLDDWGVHLYSAEKDIHGEYDNVNVPYSNLSAVVFYFKWCGAKMDAIVLDKNHAFEAHVDDSTEALKEYIFHGFKIMDK